MRKKQNMRVVGGAVLFGIVVFTMSEQVFGANQVKSRDTKQTASQTKQTSTNTPAPSRRVMPGPSSFRPDMSFEQAINILRHATKPPLNIAVLWKDLEENADIYRDTPIGIDGLSRVSIRRHLKSLLMGVSGGSPVKLGYVVDDGVIVIATVDSLPVKMTARVYDIRDLTAAPANYFFPMGMPFGGLGGLGGLGGFGGYGGYGAGGGMGMGFLGAGPGMTQGGSYGYGGGLTGLLQNQYGTGGRTYGNYSTR
jgi:hypothetical protein